MKYTLLLLAFLLAGCVKPAVYKPNPNLTQQEKDEAACGIEADKYRNSYFPTNPILNADGRRETFATCMKSKGYSAQ